MICFPFYDLYQNQLELHLIPINSIKEIKENEVDTERDHDESIDFSAIIDPTKAIEIAFTRAEVEGLTPTGWSLEADDGKQKYTIEYDQNNDNDIEIKINGITEEILEVEK